MSKCQNKFISKGLKFQCQGSGKCCVSRGEYGFVYMTLEDRKNMAKSLNLATSAFTRKFCAKTDETWHLKNNPDGPECIFLNSNRQCEVYKGRPVQCRTWPFWPENMNAKAWKKEVATYCPGVGKGPVVSPQKIQQSLDKQKRSEKEIFGPDLLVID